ncbi:2OG-Fe(II) oxygenase [Pollutimonas sp. M17]|uniref:2OG-Fe(II) oxygenase n=1 Tax=Pollutimonas sp. M17 TaxID=2962065 RepID=UPI0021F47198|nr:2OG-Fe(II) oxygenase [Pollutimonas sp. M17]UYO93632.1 2OG-Fe(II) oxygenase [Pollutimonas sp. M17]
MPPREQLLESLADQGWAVADGLIDAQLHKRLYEQCRRAWEEGRFKPAGVGHGRRLALHTEIRGDSIFWIEPQSAESASLEFLQWTDALREDLNRLFYTGLTNAEFHFARYPAGHRYRKHMDQHRDQRSRKISLVLYLNQEWSEDGHGELCLYSAQDENKVVERVLPMPGRLAVFRSDLIPHEVMPCTRPRWSLTGWFRNDAIGLPQAA